MESTALSLAMARPQIRNPQTSIERRASPCVTPSSKAILIKDAGQFLHHRVLSVPSASPLGAVYEVYATCVQYSRLYTWQWVGCALGGAVVVLQRWRVHDKQSIQAQMLPSYSTTACRLVWPSPGRASTPRIWRRIAFACVRGSAARPFRRALSQE